MAGRLAALVIVGLTVGSGEAAFRGANGRIAFASDRDGNLEVYAMSPDGSGIARLTSDPAADTAPAFAPDGGRIAFAASRPGFADVFVMAPTAQVSAT